jgi:hypothetical protein
VSEQSTLQARNAGTVRTGQIYEERGRGFLAMRGQAVYVPEAAAQK